MFQQEMGKPTQQRVTLDQTTEVVCESCKKNVFQEGMFLRRVSPLISGQSKDSYIPIPTFVCVNCGEVNDCFIPEELKSKIQLV